MPPTRDFLLCNVPSLNPLGKALMTCGIDGNRSPVCIMALEFRKYPYVFRLRGQPKSFFRFIDSAHIAYPLANNGYDDIISSSS